MPTKGCYKCREHVESVSRHVCVGHCHHPIHTGGGTHSYTDEFYKTLENDALEKCQTDCCQNNGCEHSPRN